MPQTIDRAGQLLTLVLEAERPRGLAELAGDAALPKSTASRLLSGLERQGLVQQRGHRGRFGPGRVLLRFAHRGLVDRQLAELAQPHMAALSAASEETINLAVPAPLGVEHLAQVESRHYLGTATMPMFKANISALQKTGIRDRVGDALLERALTELLTAATASADRGHRLGGGDEGAAAEVGDGEHAVEAGRKRGDVALLQRQGLAAASLYDEAA